MTGCETEAKPSEYHLVTICGTACESTELSKTLAMKERNKK